MMAIGVVINYCSNEEPFIRTLLRQCGLFADKIAVSCGSNFFDGAPEDESRISRLEAEFPNVRFVRFEVTPTVPDNDVARRMGRPISYWHNLARWTGFQALEMADTEGDWLLFLDADEIPEGDKVAAFAIRFLADVGGRLAAINVMKMANFWYFRDPTLQATQYEDSPIFSRARVCTRAAIFDPQERHGMARRAAPAHLLRNVFGTDGLPMFHHYSWVRTKAQMLRKVSTWGHRDDRNWVALVEEEFSRPFNGRDFVNGYSFRTVANRFGIPLCPDG